MPDPKPERPDLDDYLKHDDIIDYDDPIIEEVVEQLTEGHKDTVSKAQSIYEFVRDQIFHSFHINATSVTMKASEVLEKGHGICYAQSHLLAALMRAADIPAGFCYQVKLDEPDNNRLVVHGYNAIFIEETGKWIRLDPSRSIQENTTPFDFEREAPASDLNEEAGEYDDNTIYITPRKNVIRALTESEDVEALKVNLPGSI